MQSLKTGPAYILVLYSVPIILLIYSKYTPPILNSAICLCQKTDHLSGDSLIRLGNGQPADRKAPIPLRKAGMGASS